jgi:alkylhydroperoxidase/carboxymuconolactone decarboxylase family protein YurZ
MPTQAVCGISAPASRESARDSQERDGSITAHTSAAINNGATKEEIVEALGVAISVNAGAALIYSSRVLDAFHAKTDAPEGAS